MALPSVTRTWHFGVNVNSVAGATQLATDQALLRQIKNMLIGAAGITWTDGSGSTITDTGRWTVIGSSNSSTSNMTATDLWTVDTDLVWASGAHSWIVLQQAGIATKFQILIALNSNTAGQITLAFSHTGFGTANGGTNGSTSTLPTALNQTNVLTTTDFGGPLTATATRIHMMRASDGSATRIFLCRNGHSVAFHSFELAGNPVSGWTNSFVVRSATPSNTAAPTVDNPTVGDLIGVANVRGFGTVAFSAFMVTEGDISAANRAIIQTLTVPNALSGLVPILPIGIFSLTAAQEGRHGNYVDLWMAPISRPSGSTYPASGTLRQFCQFSALIVPWNQSIPQLS